MPKYKLVFSASAKKDLKKLDNETRKRIGLKLLYFLEQKDPLHHAKPLVHSSIGEYRFRVGHYRIVFDINGNNLEVVNIKHRRDIYKG